MEAKPYLQRLYAAIAAWFVWRVRVGYAAAADLAADERRADRAQMAGGNLVSAVIGIAVSTIVAVGVTIPIVNDVIGSANLSGITATVVGFIPVMIGVLVFVATVGPIMGTR